MDDQAHEVTRLLQRIASGDRTADDEFFPIVYEQLRALAHAHFRASGDAHPTLQPTALVHEAYSKLFGNRSPTFANSDHFWAVAARAMRSILVDRARARATAKRGDNPARVPLDAILADYDDQGIALVDLDDALKRLAAVSESAARVVELRFFGGLELAEVAEVLGLSLSTVEREWRRARAWLRRELSPDRGAPDG